MTRLPTLLLGTLLCLGSLIAPPLFAADDNTADQADPWTQAAPEQPAADPWGATTDTTPTQDWLTTTPSA